MVISNVFPIDSDVCTSDSTLMMLSYEEDMGKILARLQISFAACQRHHLTKVVLEAAKTTDKSCS